MTDQRVWTKKELQAEIDRTWAAINDALDELTPEQMLSPTDQMGWAVKDHLNHMAAWDNWAIYVLQGKPPWEGMGISEADYKSGDDDSVNTAIYMLHHDNSPDEARAFLQSSHDSLMAFIQPFSNAEYAGPYRDRRPDEAADRVIPSLASIIHETTADHYEDHVGWFQALVAGTA